MQEPPGVAFYGVGGHMSSFLEPVFKSIIIIIIQMMIYYNLFLHDWSIDENEKYSSVILVYRFCVTWKIISAAKIENKNFSVFGVISHFIYLFI